MATIPEFTTRPELAGTFGMVASTHWLASAAGMAVLEKGGNAFDAAAAAGFVLQVVEPHLNGPGGEVPVIGYDTRRGETFVVCGQGTAPAGATLDAYRELGLDLVPGSGLLAACVPGAFGGWLLLLREYGTLPLRDVLGYAIGYAESGFALIPSISWSIASVADLFREHWTSSARVYLDPTGGGVPAPGSRFANPALAETYKKILAAAEAAGTDREAQLEAARRAWYSGFVAEAIGKFAATEVMDVTGERHRGFLTAQDLSSWHARLEAPVTYDYQGLTVCKTGPWGQGPVFLQQLALLRRLRPGSDGARRRGVHPHRDRVRQARLRGPRGLVRRPRLHRRAARRAAVGRVQRRAAQARRRHREHGAAARPARGREPELPGFATGPFGIKGPDGTLHGAAARGSGDPGIDPATGEPLNRSIHAQARRGDTCHVDVADRWGNVVTATPSGGWLSVLAGHPRTRVLPRDAGADVRPRPRAARHDRAGQAAADHADARRWRCATASRTWRSARRAGISRTSGRSGSS